MTCAKLNGIPPNFCTVHEIDKKSKDQNKRRRTGNTIEPIAVVIVPFCGCKCGVVACLVQCDRQGFNHCHSAYQQGCPLVI
jgi:hypothetical protein